MIALRNLAYYWPGNVAVLLGVAVGAAVLTGALFVGDSLRASLAARAERQSNGVTAALVGDRLIDDRLAAKLGVTPLLMLRGTATNERGAARVTVLGLDESGLKAFHLPDVRDWQGDSGQAILSRNLAEKLNLKTGDKLKLSVQQISAVPRSSLLGRRDLDDLTTSLSLTVVVALTDEPAGEFALTPSPEPPMNLFVPLKWLQDRLDKDHRANAMLAFGPSSNELNAKLAGTLEPADWGLRVHVPSNTNYKPARPAPYVSIESDQFVIAPRVLGPIEKALTAKDFKPLRTIAYLANSIRSGENRIPYSVIAAMDDMPPIAADEILLTEWPRSPLAKLPAGSPIEIEYYLPEIEGRVQEAKASFKLAGYIPMSDVNDPNLTPPFPGITDKLKIGDWNPPFPFDSKRIQPRDEEYWNQYRTTPKAFITLAAAEKLFGSRFGVITSVRVLPAPGEPNADLAIRELLKAKIEPGVLGLQFDDTRGRLAEASAGGTDFGGLFLGFSFFLIVAALMLIGLLVRLNVERRAKDIGSLLALGYSPRQLRRSLLAECFAIAVAGTVLGIVLAFVYSRGLIQILTDLWPDDSVKRILQPHATTPSAVIGGVAALGMVMLAVFFALRSLVKLPIPQLLRGQTEIARLQAATARRRKFTLIIAILLGLAGLGAVAAGTSQSNPDLQAMSFFSGGGLLFIAGLILVRRWLTVERTSISAKSSLSAVALRNAGRFPGRSVLIVFLIGSATFLLVSVESFRRKPAANFQDEHGGSGGYNLLAAADIPVFHQFDREPGRSDFLELYRKEQQDRDLPETDAAVGLSRIQSLIPLRRRRGDDASCLNLYQASKPRLLGVPVLTGFQFAQTEAKTPEEIANPWLLLKPRSDGVIPAIGEMNSVMYMLKKAVGDEFELPDGNGTPRKFRIVATLQDSVFQSDLLISDTAFTELFPREEGYAEFLIRTPVNDEKPLAEILESGLRSHGLIVMKSRDLVASYQAVIGTYLTTFQLLGGLGLILGVLGLAAVVQRGVWERRGEFALLQAVGYSNSSIRFLVMAEHLILFAIGLLLGLVTAAISVAPHLLQTGQWPWRGALLLLAATFCVGIVTIFLATAAALRKPILPALRSE